MIMYGIGNTKIKIKKYSHVWKEISSSSTLLIKKNLINFEKF